MNQHDTRFNTLQSLRFFAAFCVIVYHTGHYLQFNGQRPEAYLPILSDRLLSYGVYLFFAISGFVLTHALERSTVPEFLALRFLRIYPAFWGAVLLVALGKLIVFGRPFTVNWRALSLLPFGIMPYPLGVEWSLVYEIFFYLVLAAMALPRSRWMLHLALMGWTTAILAGFITGRVTLPELLPTVRTIPFSLVNLAFIAGIVAHRVYPSVTKQRWILLPVSVSALLLARTTANPFHQFVALAVGCGALVLFAAAQALVRDLAAASLLVRLGDYSYGLYLLHVPVIVMLIWLPVTAHIPTGLMVIACILLSLIIGSAFGWAELHLYRRSKRLVTARRNAKQQKADVVSVRG